MNMPTIFKFVVDKTPFEIMAMNVGTAMELANRKIRRESMVKPDDNFAWFDHVEKNSFYLGHHVFMN